MPGSIRAFAMNDDLVNDRSAVSERPWLRVWRRFRRNRAALVAACVLVGLALGIAAVLMFWPHSPNQLTEAQWASPMAGHWLGTDGNGRDVLARVCAGARVSAWVGLAGAMVSLVVGVSWGATAGYVGGRLDGFLMRAVDILYSLPSILFVIVLAAVFQAPVRSLLTGIFGVAGGESASVFFLIVGVGAVSWLTMARMVRAQVVSLKHQPFIEAARALGAGHVRLLFRHLIPNTLGVIVVYLTFTVPSVILAESFLSYLGLGVQPPQASLGTLLAEGAAQINPLRSYWWLLAGPAGLLVTILLALGFVGDGLRDALDPRAEG